MKTLFRLVVILLFFVQNFRRDCVAPLLLHYVFFFSIVAVKVHQDDEAGLCVLLCPFCIFSFGFNIDEMLAIWWLVPATRLFGLCPSLKTQLIGYDGINSTVFGYIREEDNRVILSTCEDGLPSFVPDSDG